MAKKTNRTSHVMDLLTNGASGEAPETVSEAPASGQEKKSDVQSHTVTPAKVTVVDEGSMNDRVSQEILGKLTEELEAETKDQETASGTAQAQETPEQASETAPQASETPETASEAVSATTSTEAAVEAPQTSQEASTADQAEMKTTDTDNLHPVDKPHPIIPQSHFSNHTRDREYRFVNVMEQLLMRQNLDAVLTQHNVCTCPRCMTDVCALALTGLPPKYVVTSKDSISPLLSYYENKYKIPILTELMKACNKVRESPRHRKAD